MNWRTLAARVQELPPSGQIPAILLVGLVFGVLVLPAFIYVAGLALLGRIEGASVLRLYGSIYKGLVSGSVASWIVVSGPGLLYLLLRSLRSWWRRGVDVVD